MANSEQKRTGGQIELVVEGVVIPVTTASPSWNKNMQVATDSADWHAGRKTLARSQMPGVLEIEIEVGFRFYANLTQLQIIERIKYGTEPADIILRLKDDPNTVLEHGEFWFGEGSMDIEVEDNALISGSTTLTNEGLPSDA